MAKWFWPGDGDYGDFPDPLGFEGEWKPWSGTMHDGPPVLAEIFAREYVQNSWDAISEKYPDLNGASSDPRPAISFQFVRLEDAAAEEFAEALGLDEFRAAVEQVGDVQLDQRLRLAEDAWVRTDSKSIDLLIASERGGAGMYGSWEHASEAGAAPARMRLALIRSDTGKIGEDTGGSWGKGKLGVAKASKSRILAAYTCHREIDEKDPDVSRRFMGVAYWKQHDYEGLKRAGLGLLGGQTPSEDQKFSVYRPFENEAADEYVDALKVPGLENRDPSVDLDHGTSYLFVDPAFEPADLAEAVVRNWWPLLRQDLIDIEVIDRDGNSMDLDPYSRPALTPFLEANELHVNAVTEFSEVTPISVAGRDAGELKILCSEEGGWSWEELGGDRKNTDLVALVRNEMVIAYQQYPERIASRPAPYVRGVFKVSDDPFVRRDLKLVEGHLHNSWIDGGVVAKPELLDFAKKVVRGVGDKVKELRTRLADEDAESDGRVRAFDELLSLVGSRPGIDPPPPPPPPRPWVIQEASGSSIIASEENPALVRAEGQVKIGLKPDVSEDEMEVVINLGWGVVEDSRSPKRDDSLSDTESIDAPPSFTREEDGVLKGSLTKDPRWFRWKSTWFPNDWKVAPDPTVERATEDEEE